MFDIKKKFAYKKQTGYSLYETLIILAVLGIIFTLSMGNIVADYNKNQTIVRLKKIYSIINQTFLASRAVNSSINTWDIPDDLTSEDNYKFFEKYMKNFLIINKDCETSTSLSCNFVFKELNGNEKSLNSSWVRFYLNDGAFIAMQLQSTKNDKVVYFYVDTNGKNRLNVVGRDIFMFEYWIENSSHPVWAGKLLPFGHEFSRENLISNSNENNCNSKSNGNYCSALIIKDNWQILEGYPWAQARYIVK